MEWKPIATAPRDGRDVLVFGDGSYAVACWNGQEWRDMGDIGWAGMDGHNGNQPTHWMPLPEPPSTDTERNAAVAAERERCASFCEETASEIDEGRSIAADIRAGKHWV